MIIKPPSGYPRSCWNIYDGKPKKQYETLEEAQEIAKTREGYEAYFCSYCKHYHIGRTTTKVNHSMQRFPELELELGVRATAHLHMGDTITAINARCKSARNMVWRRPQQNDNRDNKRRTVPRSTSGEPQSDSRLLGNVVSSMPDDGTSS